MGLAHRSFNPNKQQTQAKPRRLTRFRIKPSVAAVYMSTFVLIVAIIFIGYQQPQNTSVVVNTATSDSTVQSSQTTSVDDVVATGVAANVAQSANLPIATSAANLAISAQTKSEFTQTDTLGASKPQLIGSDSTNRSVTSYIVKAGEDVNVLAARFGISKETIKWANNLVSDSLTIGSTVRILPIDGVLYTVKSSDTVDSIATRYGVDKTRLVLYNDLDVSGLVPNTKIILPKATLPGNERPGYVAPVVTYNNYYGFSGAGFGGRTWFIAYGTPDNGLYSHGNCTLYAYNRRKALGLPVGDHWGNAGSWAPLAASQGLTVNHSPSAGAIMTDPGHVAIVESILPNGDLSISEMNAYVSGGGYNIVSGRIVLAGNVGQYWYIH